MTLVARYHQLTEHRRITREGAAGLRTLLEPYRGAVPAQRRTRVGD
jgi:hypothetical protein